MSVEPKPTSLEDKLHVAICRAVALLNVAPEIARIPEGREIRNILREALADYADDFMERPVSETQRTAIHKKHNP